MNFNSLGLSPAILQAITEQGYETPTPIQEKAIPAVIDGRDLMAAAQTGTGKTAGFTLPILEKLSQGHRANANQARCLILTPTRELAAQIGESVTNYGKHLPLKSTVVFGGVKINPQMMKLCKGVDILVATPGRLLDLYHQNAVRFKTLEVLVLDEADRMLDMGFIHDIRKILGLLPKQRQNLMFSATFSDEVRKLARGMINNPVEISVTPRNTASTTVKQWICPVDKKQKSVLLTHLIKENKWDQVLVFTKTKHGANKLTRHLELENIKAAAIHGNKSQSARTKALANFKNGSIKILVATDIAARGLDIDQLPQVVNFDLPNVAEDYIHRIGRTGRAGCNGHAVSLVCADEFKLLSDIERLIKQLLSRKIVDGFEPVHDLPESKLNQRPIKPKKPKKPTKLGQPRQANQNNKQSEGSRHRKSKGNNWPSRRQASNKKS
ncbi:MAG: DEAD/DEAH box helicase [Methylococcales bacterium]|jgi:ATP-dependent RNA helicase RhlE|nr:DEAD/DEAH box helicase [Methylococcales bacterium]